MKITIKTEKDKNFAQEVIKALQIDNPMDVDIKPHKKNRTLAQNRLMHKWFNCIAEHWFETTGESFAPATWKLQLKRQFLGFDVKELPNGQIATDTKHTASLSTKELTEFLEKIDAYAATELNCRLPHPDDLYWEAMGIRGH